MFLIVTFCEDELPILTEPKYKEAGVTMIFGVVAAHTPSGTMFASTTVRSVAKEATFVSDATAFVSAAAAVVVPTVAFGVPTIRQLSAIFPSLSIFRTHVLVLPAP